MKGLTHFISGAAAATFVTAGVDLALDHTSFVLVLGGIGGILPDTLDFKFAQFITRKDVEVDPHPDRLDPQAIARTIADTAKRAHEEQRELTIHFNTLPLSSDLWRQYTITFLPETQEVVVTLGPAVTTSQVPQEVGLTDVGLQGRAKMEAPFDYSYDGETVVDIFNGPSFSFVPAGDRLDLRFLAWHRHWSHSLVLAAALGGLLALALGPVAGFIFGLGMAVHILEDQLGVMGSNLFWPLTRKRMKGLGWMRSTDALPNFAFVWLACTVIIFNLNRFHPAPPFPTSPLSFFVLAFAVPLAAIAVLGKLLALWEQRRSGTGALIEEKEAVDEMGDVF